MIITPHVATGAAVALIFRDPLLVFPLAISSHFLLDAIPHWDPGLGNFRKALPVIAVDLAVAGVVFAWIVRGTDGYLFSLSLGAIGGVLPDLVEAGWSRAKGVRPPKLSRLHDLLHWYQPGLRLGLAIQGVYLATLLVGISRL